nr:MAG TPA: hypothetical protein [Caudoviricetes sp.]
MRRWPDRSAHDARPASAGRAFCFACPPEPLRAPQGRFQGLGGTRIWVALRKALRIAPTASAGGGRRS